MEGRAVRHTLLLVAGGIAALALNAPAAATAGVYRGIAVRVSTSSVVSFAQLARLDAKRHAFGPSIPA